MSKSVDAELLKVTARNSGVCVTLGELDNVYSEFKFGFADALPTTEKTVWDIDAVYAYPSSAIQMKVSSSSGLDTSAGTGARTVRVFGLDQNWELADEVVIMTGQAEKLTDTTFIRVFRAHVVTAGTGESNAGDIYVGTGTVSTGVPATKYAKMLIGNNQTLMSVYTIPANTTGVLLNFFVSTVKNENVTFRLITREEGSVFRTRDKFTLYQQNVSSPRYYGVAIPPKTDIEIRGVASTSTSAVSASFEILLVES